MDSLPGGTDSEKWLECNGQYVNPALYPKLAALISYTPDYQGVFLRGYGRQTATDSYGTVVHESSAIGILQGDAIRNMTGKIGGVHALSGTSNGVFSSPVNNGATEGEGLVKMTWGDVTFDISRVVPTDIESRPVNKAVRYLIKAK